MTTYRLYTATETDAAIAAALVPPVTTLAQNTFLASGGSCAYTGTGLTFAIASGIAIFSGVSTPFSATTKTLGTADATNPRYDAIVVDSTGTVSVVAGTAAATPAFPDIDPVTQIALTYVSVPATAVTLSITTTSIYAEDAEWTSSVSGGTVSAASTTTPHAGTKCIRFTAAAAGDYARLTSTAISLADKRQLSLYLTPTGTWPSQKSVLVTWYNGTTKIGQSVGLKNGAFGLRTDTASYQFIVLPISAFAIPAGATVTRLEFKINGGGATISLGIDDVLLESTSTLVATTIGHTHDAADVVSGTLATARLGSGTANSGTFLRGDQSWQVVASGPPSRAAVTITTASLANGAQEIGSKAAYTSFMFCAVQVDRACRVRFYKTSAGATADASRAVGVALTEAQRASRGLCGELVKSSAGTDPCFPNQPTFSNGDGSPAATLYYVIDNLSGATHTVTVTITALPTES